MRTEISGLRYDVDHHYERLFGFAALTSAFSAALDLSQRNTQSVLTYPSVGDTASAAVGREMEPERGDDHPAQPERAADDQDASGYKFNVRVNRDSLFNAPYQPMEANPLPTEPGQFQRRTDFVTTGQGGDR